MARQRENVNGKGTVLSDIIFITYTYTYAHIHDQEFGYSKNKLYKKFLFTK